MGRCTSLEQDLKSVKQANNGELEKMGETLKQKDVEIARL